MVQTTTEILSVNGTVLNTLAKNIDSIQGRLRAPAFRTGNLVVPARHGELRTPNKKFQANTIALPIWVEGCNDDGGIPGGSTKRREFFARVNELVTLFKSPSLLDIRWTKADGSIRQTFAEALDVMDFTTGPAPSGRVGVVLTIPGVFWQDLNTVTNNVLGTGTTLTPSNFVGGSAPIEDLIATILGPWTNPRATFSDGSWFQYNGNIPATQTLTINSGDWTLSGAGGLTPDYAVMTHDGADAYWAALPASAGAITLAGTNRTTASNFTITGRRKYLVG